MGFKPESSEKKYVHSDNLNHLPPPNFSNSAFFLAWGCFLGFFRQEVNNNKRDLE